MASRVIGIDLGTSSSLVAVLDGGKPKLIPDSRGRTVMPSLIVVRDDHSILAGHEAEAEARKYSQKNLLIASLKRSMGKSKDYGLHDAKMPVQVLAAILLSELKLYAEAFLGERVEKAVIAVPAHFSFTQRQVTKEAALIAGLEPLRIVNEATASMCTASNNVPGKVIVADLGGGTFDVSAVEFWDGVTEVVATSGDEKLGGEDFTTELYKLLLSKIPAEFDAEIVSSDPITFQRVMDAAEDLKRQLTSCQSAEVSVPYVRTRYGTYTTLTCSVTRKEFEDACDQLFARTEKVLHKVLSDARWRPADFTAPTTPATESAKRGWLKRMFSYDKVEQQPTNPAPPVFWLIGNASRMPEIRYRLRSKYPYCFWHPAGMLDVKSPVALGAARIAGILEGIENKALLMDVSPNTLSIETQGGVSTAMIPRNTRIPTSYAHRFTTVHDNQATISARIHEGERPLAKDNRTIGTLHIENIPVAPAGFAKIEVRFDVDVSGLLSVTGTDLETGRAVTLRCSELILSDKKLNDYHLLVQNWTQQRRSQM